MNFRSSQKRVFLKNWFSVRFNHVAVLHLQLQTLKITAKSFILVNIKAPRLYIFRRFGTFFFWRFDFTCHIGLKDLSLVASVVVERSINSRSRIPSGIKPFIPNDNLDRKLWISQTSTSLSFWKFDENISNFDLRLELLNLNLWFELLQINHHKN